MIWLMPWDAEHPSRHLPWATYTLLLLNLSVFLGLVMAGHPQGYERWFSDLGLVPSEPRWYQFLTASFVHAGFWHLLGNLLFLYVFGDNVEDVLGPAGMVLLYFAGGLLGDLAFVAANPELSTPTLGASGCIATLAGAYAVMFFAQPIGVRVMLLVFPLYTFRLQALWVLLLWFGFDVYRTLDAGATLDAGGGVNYVSHGVGFGSGVALALFARLHGVMRRFHALPRGHAWFGYWPGRLEEGRPRRRSP